jgi:two-component system response regulator YesN
MYKVLVVDDEAYLRKSLSRFIGSVDSDFIVAESLSDGSEAIEYLKNNYVDIVFCDIKMERISGLEVAKWIKENCSYIKVVLVSGYKEFEYAKKAIEYNVEYYLLKPSKTGEIKEALTAIKRKLKIENTNKKKLDFWQPLLKEQFILEIVLGELTDAVEIERRARLIDFALDINKSCCAIVLASVEKLNDKWNYGDERLTMAACNLLKEPKEGLYCLKLLRETDKIYLAAVSRDYIDNSAMRESLERRFAEANETGGAFLGLKIRYNMISRTVPILKLSDSSVYYNQDDYNKVGSIKRKINGNNGELAPPSIKDAKNYDKLIEQVKEYIENNIQNDICLDRLSDLFFFSSAHFSRLFKKYTGVNLSDYIINKKISLAIELLKKRKYKIYEIGEKVGYGNSKSFNRVFKKCTGYTPKEYCRIALSYDDENKE